MPWKQTTRRRLVVFHNTFAFLVNRNFYFALLTLTLGGFGMMLFFSTSNTIIQTLVPNEMRGRVMGVWALAFGTMVPLGSLEAGVLAHWLGAPITIAFGGFICAMATLVTLAPARRRDSKEEQVKTAGEPSS